MALRRLYEPVTGSANPSYLTGLLPGGASVQTAGVSTNPGISAPRPEEVLLEVFDVTATGSTVQPAAAGKLVVQDLSVGSFGASWRLNTTRSIAVGRGQYGIVVAPGQAVEATAAAGTSTGTKALVMIDGPVQAYLTSSARGNTTAISAGMALSADDGGNLTYAGAAPAAGTVLARAAGNLAASTSAPVLTNVYIGGY